MIKAKNKIVLFRMYVLLLLSSLVIPLAAGGCKSNNSAIQGVNYKKVNDVYGTIKVSGSTTMSNLMSLWCTGFSDMYHNTNCLVESFGSGKAPKDLTKGNIDIGMMSKPMSSKDRQDFKNTYGYEPVEIKVAIDMIAVLVSIENPINCITIDELDGVYSNTYLCQGSTDITTWGDLNLVGEWKNTPIKVYGRTPASGTYNVFRKMALCNGTYKKSITELASSRDIVDFVSRDASSIGYSGAGLLTSAVKAVNIGKSNNNCYPPKSEYAVSRQYPFTKNLYLYLRESPSKGMKELTREFLKYIMSKDGQEAITESGLITLPASIIKEERKKITD